MYKKHEFEQTRVFLSKPTSEALVRHRAFGVIGRRIWMGYQLFVLMILFVLFIRSGGAASVNFDQQIDGCRQGQGAEGNPECFSDGPRAFYGAQDSEKKIAAHRTVTRRYLAHLLGCFRVVYKIGDKGFHTFLLKCKGGKASLFLYILIQNICSPGFRLQAGMAPLYGDEHGEGAGDDQHQSRGGFFGKLLMEHEEGKGDGHQDTQLIDGHHRAGGTHLQRFVIAEP